MYRGVCLRSLQRNQEADTALNLCIKSDRLRSSGQMAHCVQLLVDAGAQSNIQDLVPDLTVAQTFVDLVADLSVAQRYRTWYLI
ncbi:hypothetical protein ElyMa_004308200 [Elysia marginata]|uniref:Uncharacterized protein n=1 Tax=Elysia marginata TaxID=1093978 RepID=A0AAV4GZU4_9GAST|nr:hypothetical protein ElyMa_004308200 [Elysia marginata]